MKNRALFLFFTILLNSNAYAIVSLENLHFGDSKPGFNGSLTGAINGASGNSDRIRGTGTGILQWNLEESVYYLSASTGYGKSQDVVDQNESFLHGRRIADVTKGIAWETFAQMERDEFARLKLRAIGGGGLRFLMGKKTPQHALFLGTGAFYSHELIDDEDKTTNKSVKANVYILFKRKIGQHAAFVNTLYAQPNVVDPNDFRLLERATLRVSVTNSIALKLDLEVRHDNRPPEEVEKTDIKYTTGIEYNF